MPFPFNYKASFTTKSLSKKDAQDLVLAEVRDSDGKVEIIPEENKFKLEFLTALSGYRAWIELFFGRDYNRFKHGFWSYVAFEEREEDLIVHYEMNLITLQIVCVLTTLICYADYAANTEVSNWYTPIYFISFWFVSSYLLYRLRKDRLNEFIFCALDEDYKEKIEIRKRKFNFICILIPVLFVLFFIFFSMISNWPTGK